MQGGGSRRTLAAIQGLQDPLLQVCSTFVCNNHVRPPTKRSPYLLVLQCLSITSECVHVCARRPLLQVELQGLVAEEHRPLLSATACTSWGSLPSMKHERHGAGNATPPQPASASSAALSADALGGAADQDALLAATLAAQTAASAPTPAPVSSWPLPHLPFGLDLTRFSLV